MISDARSNHCIRLRSSSTAVEATFRMYSDSTAFARAAANGAADSARQWTMTAALCSRVSIRRKTSAMTPSGAQCRSAQGIGRCRMTVVGPLTSEAARG